MQSEADVRVLRDYQPSDREWVTRAHVRHYERIEGFDPSFSEAVSTALDQLEGQLEDGDSKFLIVEAGERPHPVGCVFFSVERPAVGRLRLFYLGERYRGLGIGRQMIGKIIQHAGDRGFETILVSTFDRHGAACHLYRASGFRERAREPALAFGLRMRRIDFEKTLPDHSR